MTENIDITVGDENPSGGPPKKPLIKKLMIVPIIIAVLGIQSVAAYFTINYFLSAGGTAVKTEETAPGDSLAADSEQSADENGKKEEKGKDKEKGKEGGTSENQLYEFKDLVVNPAGTMGRRYFVVSMNLEVSTAGAMEEMKVKDFIIRDSFITLFSQKTLDYLADVANMDTIRTNIMETCNSVLTKGKITKVYFTSYILQ